MEYTAATKAMTEALRRGASLEAALRAFALETESTVDDRVVSGAVDAVESIAQAARMIAARALTMGLIIQGVADAIEEKTPEAREGVAEFSKFAAEVADLLDSLTIRDQ